MCINIARSPLHYVKASNPDQQDVFGYMVALDSTGGYLVIGAPHDSSNASGIDGDQNDDSSYQAGAVYLY